MNKTVKVFAAIVFVFTLIACSDENTEFDNNLPTDFGSERDAAETAEEARENSVGEAMEVTAHTLDDPESLSDDAVEATDSIDEETEALKHEIESVMSELLQEMIN